MKYVIVSIYDSGYGFMLCDNGECRYRELENEEDYTEEYYAYLNGHFREWLLNRFKDYDLIVVCEDGNVEVLKDTIKAAERDEFIAPSIIAEGEEDDDIQ